MRWGAYTGACSGQRYAAASLPLADIWRITRLFERVRYGQHVAEPIEEAEARACLEAIVRACGSGRYVHAPWPEERKTIEVGDVVTDFAKLTRHTGWKPATRLAEGLEKTAAFYRQNREHYW